MKLENALEAYRGALSLLPGALKRVPTLSICLYPYKDGWAFCTHRTDKSGKQKWATWSIDDADDSDMYTFGINTFRMQLSNAIYPNIALEDE